MRFNKLDLNLLVALDAMLNLKSVSRAARTMNMTQSAMSNALTRLRTYFEDDLLVKVGRDMELTPRAEALKDTVRDVLVRIEWTISATSQFDPAGSERVFNILASDYTMATLIPAVLAMAHRQGANVRFNFLQQSPSPEKSLERGEVDLLIIPKEFCSAHHPSETIFEEEFCCLVWSKSRFAKRGISHADFLAARHIVMQPPGGGLSLEPYFVKKHSIVRRVDVTTFTFTSIPPLLIGSDRIATVHRRLAEQAGLFLPVTIVTSPLRLPKMEQVAQWHKYRSQDPGLIWLRTLMRNAGRDMHCAADDRSL